MTRYSKLWIAAFSVATVAFAGCTNDEDLGARDGNAGAASPEADQKDPSYIAARQKVCEGADAFAVACPDKSLNCKYQDTPTLCLSVVAPGVLENYASCLKATTSCDVNTLDQQRSCFEHAVTTAGADWSQRCISFGKTCDVKDDVCLKPHLLGANDRVHSALEKCLEGACTSLPACIDAAVRGPGCTPDL